MGQLGALSGFLILCYDQVLCQGRDRTAASGHKKAEGLDIENLTGGLSGEPPMQNLVPLVCHRYNIDHLNHWSLSGSPPEDHRSSLRTVGQQSTEIQCTGHGF
ncbi:hypothetical protein HAX54_026010 [Datura stramonium]|uniref:Uncharacterized protein n=1 Tax=Datura stramonium TaxID=4076 RepID=A0ABS8V172_DATST|nr:hypothetical protein [Datura stramonium]